MTREVAEFSPWAEALILHGDKAGNGEPLEVDAEKQHEQERQPEGGHGETKKNEHRDGAVKQ